MLIRKKTYPQTAKCRPAAKIINKCKKENATTAPGNHD